MAYLDAYLDPALEIRKGDTLRKMSLQEIKRLQHLMAVAAAAQHVKRRLGADASDDELARDKHQSRRLVHVARQCIVAWGGEPHKRLERCDREAAQIVWVHWAAGNQTYLLNRMRYIATWSYKTGGDPRWAKSAIVKLNNELNWIDYALR